MTALYGPNNGEVKYFFWQMRSVSKLVGRHIWTLGLPSKHQEENFLKAVRTGHMIEQSSRAVLYVAACSGTENKPQENEAHHVAKRHTVQRNERRKKNSPWHVTTSRHSGNTHISRGVGGTLVAGN